MQPTFTINLGDKATITASTETGEVIGRAEYTNSEPTYYLRYKASDGRAVEQWWSQSALSPAQQ